MICKVSQIFIIVFFLDILQSFYEVKGTVGKSQREFLSVRRLSTILLILLIVHVFWLVEVGQITIVKQEDQEFYYARILNHFKGEWRPKMLVDELKNASKQVITIQKK